MVGLIADLGTKAEALGASDPTGASAPVTLYESGVIRSPQKSGEKGELLWAPGLEFEDPTGEDGAFAASTSTRSLFELSEDDDDLSHVEDALFGGEPSITGTSTPSEPIEPDDAGAGLAKRLGLRNDVLQIGGVVWLRLQYNALSEGAFSTFALVSPNLLDLYLDARPNDRLRFYAQGRLNFDPTVRDGSVSALGTPLERTSVQLDQLWLKFDVLQRVYLTVGKQRIRWGSSRLWNPTDFLNQQRLDPLAFFDQRLGVSLVKVHVPVEALGWNFYALANLEDASNASEVGGALRAEVVVGPAEIAASFAVRKNNPERYGLDLSAGIWELDVRAELAVLHGVKTPFFRTPEEGAPTASFDDDRDEEQGSAISRAGDFIPQLVLGAEWVARYGDDDLVVTGLEYFYNDAGYADETFYPQLALSGALTPLYVGRHYLGLSVVLAGPGQWDDTSFSLSAIANLSDLSAIARFDFSLKVLTYLSFRTFLSVHAGRGELRFGIDVPPVHIVAPLFEIGAALTLDF